MTAKAVSEAKETTVSAVEPSSTVTHRYPTRRRLEPTTSIEAANEVA